MDLPPPASGLGPPRGKKPGKYAPRELDAWRRRIAAWRSRHEIFAYFNNDWEGYAPRNAIELARSFR